MSINIWKIGTLITAVFLIALGVYYFWFIRYSPIQQINRFYSNLCDGNINDATNQLSASVPEPVTKLGLAYLVRECKENGGLNRVEVIEEKITNNDIAFVNGFLIYNNAKKEPISMKLYHEDYRWKIAWQGSE